MMTIVPASHGIIHIGRSAYRGGRAEHGGGRGAGDSDTHGSRLVSGYKVLMLYRVSYRVFGY
jgi:hypothetical protein